MSDFFYVDTAVDELIRSSLEEEQFRHRSLVAESKRFRQRAPSEVILKIGPADSALCNSFLLTLICEGRMVSAAEVEIGWQHQGLEKNLEFVSWKEVGQLLLRINSQENSSLILCHRLALERLFELTEQISLHERLLRVSVLEAERIAHHWRVIDSTCELILSVPQREPIKHALQLSKALYALVQQQLLRPKEPLADVKVKLEKLRTMSEPIIEALPDIGVIQSRLQGRAKVNRTAALSAGLTGIYVRACGSVDDVRSAHPELPYPMLNFTPKTKQQGDAFARFVLRLDEIENAMLLIGHALRLAYEPDIASLHVSSAAELFQACSAPKGRQVVTSFLESPEGEMAISACSSGQETPHRFRIKTPSFSLTSAMDLFLKGHDLDDVVLILNSLGIDTLEVDR